MLHFAKDDKIICKAARNYSGLTENKVYIVLSYEEAGRDGENPFIWPAYVKVEDDNGKIISCHASRFIKE